MTQQSNSRHLTWYACYNTRELGGYPTIHEHQTQWRRVVRSDSLHRLTSEGEAALRAYGVRTVIDLRTPQEVAVAPYDPTRLQGSHQAPVYAHIPLTDELPVFKQQSADGVNPMADFYRHLLDTCGHRFVDVIRVVAGTPGAVLFFCHVGKDRTGLVTALLLDLAGVSHDTIAADYGLSADNLQPLFQSMIGTNGATGVSTIPAPWLLASQPETMLATLSHLKQIYNGTGGYLRQHGLSYWEIQQVLAHLLA